MNLFNSLKTNLLMTDEHNSSSKTTTTKTTTTTTTTTTYITASSPDIAIAINYINCDAAVKLRNSLLGDGQVTKGIDGGIHRQKCSKDTIRGDRLVTFCHNYPRILPVYE